MEFEEMKNKHNMLTAPMELSGGAIGDSKIYIDDIIGKIKSEDDKQLKALKKAKLLWLAAGVISLFSLLVILSSVLFSSYKIESGFPLRFLQALIFIGLSIAVIYKIKELSTLDYSEPAFQFLQKAKKRYQFIGVSYLIFSIIATLILAAAASMYIENVFERYLGITERFIPVITTFVFVTAVYLFGYYVSKKEWLKTRGPLFDEIRKIEEDLLKNPD
jgi:hypothetical protein